MRSLVLFVLERIIERLGKSINKMDFCIAKEMETYGEIATEED